MRRVSSHCRVSNTKTLRFPAFSLPQSRHSLFALDEKPFTRTPVDQTARLDREKAEQSWNSVRAKSLSFPAFAQKHCSIDLRFSFARGARREKVVDRESYLSINPAAKTLHFPAHAPKH
jgi:hypothetical protein